MNDSLPSPTPEFSRRIDLRRANRGAAIPIDETATPAEQEALAAILDAIEVPKFRMTATLSPLGRDGWSLKGSVRATVIQPCVVSLRPVVSRIDAPISLRYMPEERPNADIEVMTELSDDVDTEPLTPQIDVGLAAQEALALALPPYPRHKDASLPAMDDAGDTPDAAEEKPNPFAALSELRDKLEGKE
ncbi:uncharacterized metal-binding protein YceD (DUF177 family) [Rubricella aquisinus]|uniref:Uncharacterized metal-binding protein YceD (DUF177 family) n=1 Tax=Rubricella aquisinus TaxID=2028108 RepID=A0A840X6N8_9RHOB|nr:DUF177 domain-containing protein [Rubricella aquisinus]MBB5516367.1 uncharacterized metal-binding protein YceD (DUF177 family) [Rubricella aquisinus]